MKFLADVPIGRATIAFLQQAGHDAIRVMDRLPANSTDFEEVRLAIREDGP